MRRVARVDANQQAIVLAFRQMGCSVQSLAPIGAGCPDLVCGLHSHAGHTVNLLIEVKDGAKPPSRRRLTEEEARWHANWRGQVCIVESLEDVAQIVDWARSHL